MEEQGGRVEWAFRRSYRTRSSLYPYTPVRTRVRDCVWREGWSPVVAVWSLLSQDMFCVPTLLKIGTQCRNVCEHKQRGRARWSSKRMVEGVGPACCCGCLLDLLATTPQQQKQHKLVCLVLEMQVERTGAQVQNKNADQQKAQCF